MVCFPSFENEVERNQSGKTSFWAPRGAPEGWSGGSRAVHTRMAWCSMDGRGLVRIGRAYTGFGTTLGDLNSPRPTPPRLLMGLSGATLEGSADTLFHYPGYLTIV